MAFEKFEQNGVNYTLLLENHKPWSWYPLIKSSGGLNSLDVLVLETTGICFGERNDFIKEAYRDIFDKIPYENPCIKIYNADFLKTFFGRVALLGEIALSVFTMFYGLTAFKGGEITRREALKRMGKLGVGLFGATEFGNIINSFCDKEDIEVLSKLNTARTIMLPTPRVGFRDAATARIIEEYIIPSERSSKSLSLGILFGASHTGIEEHIRYKSLRNVVIEGYKLLDYPGTTKDELNKIEKIVYRDGEYVCKKIELDLF